MIVEQTPVRWILILHYSVDTARNCVILTSSLVTRGTNKLKKQTLAQRNAQIEVANKRFMKMPKPRRRVAIARDVLAQLGTKIIATTGIYLQSNDLDGVGDTTKTLGDQLQKHLRKVKSCNACGLGALLFCAVTRANDLKVSDSNVSFGNVPSNKSYLKRFFDTKQLGLIETAFEQGVRFAETGTSQKQINAAFNFVSEVPKADKYAHTRSAHDLRLRLIMENIIANGGTFKPEIKPRFQIVTPGFKG